MSISNFQHPSFLKTREIKDEKTFFCLQRGAVDCVNCGSDEHNVVHHFEQEYCNPDSYETYSGDVGVLLNLTLVKCKGCELVYQSPRFSKESLQRLYPNHPLPDRLIYKRLMRNHKFHFLIDLLREHATTSLGSKTAVDLGTRYGVLPELLVNEGYNALGIEMNLKAVKIANQAGFSYVHQGTVDKIQSVCANAGIERVNLVTMVDLVEHLLDPRRDFELISRMQQSGDQIFISTMDVASLGYKILGKNSYFIHAQHTCYFSAKTMGDLLDKFSYDIKFVHRISRVRNLKLLPRELNKLRKHNALRAQMNEARSKERNWFAACRPALFDYMNIFAVKR